MRKIDRDDLWMWLVPFDEAGIHLKPLVLWLSLGIGSCIIAFYYLPQIIHGLT
jgi:cytochrome oxidase assembly protein ShyY1